MNKNRFKIVAVLIIVSLSAFIVTESLLIYSVYNKTSSNIRQQVENAITSALYKEQIANGAVPSDLNLPKPNAITIVNVKKNPKGDARIEIFFKGDSLQSMSLNAFSLNHKGQINKLNIKKADSILTENLELLGIEEHYSNIRFKSLKDSSDVEIFKGGADFEGVRTVDVPVFANMNEEYMLQYVVSIANPNKAILQNMFWVIVLALFITFLIVFSFIYLLRTLFKYKSIEEIRRDLTHNITHELKTPIAVAYAAGDTLLNLPSIGENKQSRHQYLVIVQNQLELLSGMVEKILNISFEEDDNYKLQMSQVNVLEMFEEIKKKYSLKYNKDVEYEINIPDNIFITADRFHINNIFGNIIDNAIKYSGKSVSIGVCAVKEGDAVSIAISDNGIGMESSVLGRIFDKFYRIPMGDLHDVKGYGLGLYYAKIIVEKHGGKITAESVPGEGSKFTIKLPDYGG